MMRSSLQHRGSSGGGIHISAGQEFDSEAARKPSGDGLADEAKKPSTWLSVGTFVMSTLAFLGVMAIALVFGLLFHSMSGKVGDLQDQVDMIQAKGTPGACYDGCAALVESCTVPSDCTALLVTDGTNSSTDCYYGVCVYLTVPPAFPVPAGVLANDMCAKTLNHTAEPRIPCLAGSTVESSDMASYCMFLNGCGTYTPPPIISRDIAELETGDKAEAEEVVSEVPEVEAAVPTPAPAARSVRRAVRK